MVKPANSKNTASNEALKTVGLWVRELNDPNGYWHSFAIDVLANGVPDATVAALLGHSSTAMLHKHYSHLTARADVLRKAASMVR